MAVTALSNTVSNSTRLTLNGDYQGQTGSYNPQFTRNKTILLGTGDGQADLAYWEKDASIANGASVDIDIHGQIQAQFGGTIDAAKVKQILLVNKGTDDADQLLIGGGTNNLTCLPAAMTCPAGGEFEMFGPGLNGLAAVGAGTSDIITISNTGPNNITYDLLVVCTSA